MSIVVTLETIMIFVAFLVVVFVIYKLFKFIIRASIIVIASFAFPWVARYVGLPIVASLETGITFALLGLGVFFVYEFYNFLVQLVKILIWPFKKKK